MIVMPALLISESFYLTILPDDKKIPIEMPSVTTTTTTTTTTTVCASASANSNRLPADFFLDFFSVFVLSLWDFRDTCNYMYGCSKLDKECQKSKIFIRLTKILAHIHHRSYVSVSDGYSNTPYVFFLYRFFFTGLSFFFLYRSNCWTFNFFSVY